MAKDSTTAAVVAKLPVMTSDWHEEREARCNLTRFGSQWACRRSARPSPNGLLLLASLALLVSILGACAADGVAADPRETTVSSTSRIEPERLEISVVSESPHDTSSYTQGLLWWDGRVYESAGGYGRSSLRSWALGTADPLEILDLEEEYFAEGLARIGEQLLQLTWKGGLLYVYDLKPLTRVETHRYSGLGWGLAFDGTHLIMSDGSHVLSFRNPETFEVVRRLVVKRHGSVQADLNELEFAHGVIYANVYQTDEIVRIDPETGAVTAVIDASGLLTEDERRSAEVLNGIAFREDSGTFLITGKYWPRLFEVEFVKASDS